MSREVAPKWRSAVVLFAAAILVGGAAGQRDDPKVPQTLYDDDLNIRDYTPMAHPGPNDASGEGIVVVLVELNSRGKPTSGRALSGPEGLRTTAVENAKLMWFAANAANAAIVVFEFRVTDACFGANYWVAANLVTITGCRRQYPRP